MNMIIPVVVLGKHGYMATMIAKGVKEHKGFKLESQIQLSKSPDKVSVLNEILKKVDSKNTVVVDFTHRDVTMSLLQIAQDFSCKLVIGTSGLSLQDKEQLQEISKKRAIFYGANFSLGVFMLHKMLSLLAKNLPDSWQCSILDIHHAKKLDKPSATACSLAESWQLQHNVDNNDIGALRFGDGVSEHTAFIAGTGERLELTHRLLNREAFLPSILAAIKFIYTAESGLYSMEHLYNID